MTLPLQSNLLGLPMAPAQCVVDPAKEMLVRQAVTQSIADGSWQHSSLQNRYFETFQQWIKATRNNVIKGLDQFGCMTFSAGTTESFDKFYLKHRDRGFRCFRGEYLYHRLVWQNQSLNWQYLDDGPIQAGDAVIISLPFADTGSTHRLYTRDLLDRCGELDVPILIDCAFFGICGFIEFDFSHHAIKEITFSLSKIVPASTLRIGIRFARQTDGDGIDIYNATQYINCLGMAAGTLIMQQHHADETYDRYRKKQIDWCNKYDLLASDTVIFGLDTKHLYDHYNRGYPHSNRLCFAKYYNQGQVPLP